ncbi:hypothetical protein BDV12DRAFT_172704 [Aspergillus spectabilis]
MLSYSSELVRSKIGYTFLVMVLIGASLQLQSQDASSSIKKSHSSHAYVQEWKYN